MTAQRVGESFISAISQWYSAHGSRPRLLGGASQQLKSGKGKAPNHDEMVERELAQLPAKRVRQAPKKFGAGDPPPAAAAPPAPSKKKQPAPAKKGKATAKTVNAPKTQPAAAKSSTAPKTGRKRKTDATSPQASKKQKTVAATAPAAPRKQRGVAKASAAFNTGQVAAQAPDGSKTSKRKGSDSPSQASKRQKSTESDQEPSEKVADVTGPTSPTGADEDAAKGLIQTKLVLTQQTPPGSKKTGTILKLTQPKRPILTLKGPKPPVQDPASKKVAPEKRVARAATESPGASPRTPPPRPSRPSPSFPAHPPRQPISYLQHRRAGTELEPVETGWRRPEKGRGHCNSPSDRLTRIYTDDSLTSDGDIHDLYRIERGQGSRGGPRGEGVRNGKKLPGETRPDRLPKPYEYPKGHIYVKEDFSPTALPKTSLQALLADAEVTDRDIDIAIQAHALRDPDADPENTQPDRYQDQQSPEELDETVEKMQAKRKEIIKTWVEERRRKKVNGDEDEDDVQVLKRTTWDSVIEAKLRFGFAGRNGPVKNKSGAWGNGPKEGGPKKKGTKRGGAAAKKGKKTDGGGDGAVATDAATTTTAVTTTTAASTTTTATTTTATAATAAPRRSTRQPKPIAKYTR